MIQLYRLTILCLLIFGLTHQISAQIKNYQPAEITLKDGSIIKGLINNQEWRTSPNEISFRKTEKASVEILTVKEIASFTVENEKYISREIIYENSPVRNMGKVQASIQQDIAKSAIVEDGGGLVSLESQGVRLEPLFDTTHIFLKTIIGGEKSLFQYLDKGSRSHFFIKDGKNYELLYYFIGREKVDLNDPDIQLTSRVTIQIFEDKKFHKQLLDYFKDCSGIAPLITSADYRYKDIVNLFNEYYECKGQEKEFETRFVEAKVKLNLLAGVAFNGHDGVQFTQNLTTFRHLIGGEYTYPLTFTGGIGVDMPMFGNLSRHAFVTELLYRQMNITGTWENQDGVSIIRSREFVYNMAHVRWNIMYRYKPVSFNNGTLFLNAGLSNGFTVFVGDNTMTEITDFGSTTAQRELEAIDPEAIRFLHFGAVGGIGANYSRLSGEFRFELGGDMTEFSAANINTRSFYFVLGYQLNK